MPPVNLSRSHMTNDAVFTQVDIASSAITLRIIHQRLAVPYKSYIKLCHSYVIVVSPRKHCVFKFSYETASR
jgi:hypothetical protein